MPIPTSEHAHNSFCANLHCVQFTPVNLEELHAAGHVIPLAVLQPFQDRQLQSLFKVECIGNC